MSEPRALEEELARDRDYRHDDPMFYVEAREEAAQHNRDIRTDLAREEDPTSWRSKS